MDLGLERAGMECAWQVEIDPFCRKVLTKHWPGVPKYKDVKDVGKHNLERPDLIAGGFPCQDISIAGKREGIDGTRSGLWSEYYRIICELRPQFVVVENVSALLVRGLERVLGNLAAGGYDAEWDVLPASAFGAPHQRERLFLVAYSGESSCRFSRILDRSNGFPRDEQWRTTQGVESGRGWERWLKAACEDMDRQGRNPWFRRMDDGVENEVDKHRFAGLGNAVVPQVAQWIGERIIAAQRESGFHPKT